MFFLHTNIQEFPVFGKMKYLTYWLGELENEVFLAQVELIVRAKIRYFTHTNTNYDWLFREST